jgi:hypothetical protein
LDLLLLQNLVGGIIASLPALVSVIILAAFFFVTVGIAMVQLFGGVLDNRCGYPDFADAHTDSEGIVQVCEFFSRS